MELCSNSIYSLTMEPPSYNEYIKLQPTTRLVKLESAKEGGAKEGGAKE